MATLETQYKNFLKDNPDKHLTYEEWFSRWGEINNIGGNGYIPPYISDDFQIGPDGAYEHLSVEDAKDQLIDLLMTQVTDLTMMSKIELGDDVIIEIKRLKTIISNKDVFYTYDTFQEEIKHAMNHLPDEGLFPNYTDADIYRSGIDEGIRIALGISPNN